MYPEFKDKTIAITGGAQGIGLACAELLVTHQANVLLLDLDGAAGAAAQSQLGPRCLAVKTDVTVAAEIEAALQAGQDRFGQLHHLINNAGILGYANCLTCTEAEWDRVLAVNLKSYFLTAKYAIPLLTQNPSQGGVIINVASALSFLGAANNIHYLAAKSGLLGLTRGIAIDHAPHIRCLAICPGTVDTPMARTAWAEAADPDQIHQNSIEMHQLKRIAQPREVAEMIVFACSDRCPFMTGQAIRVDGGLGIAIPSSVKEEDKL